MQNSARSHIIATSMKELEAMFGSSNDQQLASHCLVLNACNQQMALPFFRLNACDFYIWITIKHTYLGGIGRKYIRKDSWII